MTNQPWQSINSQQFKFIQDAMMSHEYADIAAKLNETQLQNRIGLLWNLHQQGKLSYNKAIEGVCNSGIISKEDLLNTLNKNNVVDSHQLFIENLYANFRWTEYAHQEQQASVRIGFAQELWVKFQNEFDLSEYPTTQETYNSLVMDFAEKNLQEYE